jgi:hypothetical protein
MSYLGFLYVKVKIISNYEDVINYIGYISLICYLSVKTMYDKSIQNSNSNANTTSFLHNFLQSVVSRLTVFMMMMMMTDTFFSQNSTAHETK